MGEISCVPRPVRVHVSNVANHVVGRETTVMTMLSLRPRNGDGISMLISRFKNTGLKNRLRSCTQVTRLTHKSHNCDVPERVVF